MKSDLAPMSTYNLLIKYADDVDLLVPQTSDVNLARYYARYYDLGFFK